MPSSPSNLSNTSKARPPGAASVPLDSDYYARVFDSLEDYAVFTLDPQGHIASWNAGAERLFGYPKQEILGQNAAILFTPEDIQAKAPKQELNSAIKSGKANDERWHVRKDGSRFWASGLVFPLKDRDGQPIGFSKIARDLTERRQAQSSLKQEEDRFRKLMNQSADAVQLIDAEGQINYSSESVHKILGYHADEVIGTSVFSYIHQEDLLDFKLRFAKLLTTPQHQERAQYRVRHKNGSWAWVEATGINLLDDSDIKAVIGNFHDISEHKELERTLKQSEERFRTLIEKSADAIQLIDADGKIAYTSDSVRQVLGYSPEEIAGSTAVDYVHPEDFRYFGSKMAELMSRPGAQVSAQYRVRHKNGSWAWVEATGTNHLNDPAIKAIVGNFRNITEHKKVAIEQELLSRQFEAVLNQMPAGVIIAESPSGKLILGNSSVEKIWGHPLIRAQDISQYRPYQGFHADGTPYSPEDWPMARSIRQGRTIIDEQIIFQRSDGSRGVMSVSSSPVKDSKGKTFAAVTIFTDITDKATSEEQVGRLAAIVDSSYDAIISKNLDSVIQTWNPAAEKLFGYTAQEAIGQHISITIPSELIDEEQKIISNIRKGIPVDHYETVRRAKDGRRLEVSLSISPVRDSKGQIIGASNIARDISERRKLERQKDDFIGIATHELKTPVTSIKAYVQALHRRFIKAGDDHTAEAIAKIDGQLNKMTHLIQDLLDVTRMGQDRLPLHKAAFSLDKVVEEAREGMQHSTTKQIIVNGKIGAKLNGDADRIGQVITNYLSNAIKYSPNTDKVIIHCYTKDGQAVIGVQDFGVGIAPDKQPFVFERFYRVSGPKETTYPGLGLGLYISFQIIQRHGGKIWLESAIGQGSTFYFSLPLKKSKAEKSVKVK